MPGTSRTFPIAVASRLSVVLWRFLRRRVAGCSFGLVAARIATRYMTRLKRRRCSVHDLLGTVDVVSLEYVTLILRADNHGEGGIMALLALVISAVKGCRGCGMALCWPVSSQRCSSSSRGAR